MRISDWSSDVCSSDLRSEADGEIIGFVAVEQPPRELRRLAQGNRQNAGRERIERPAMPQLQTAIVVLAQDALYRARRMRRADTEERESVGYGKNGQVSGELGSGRILKKKKRDKKKQ